MTVIDPTIDASRVISMTELQKLSLRKLREMRLHESPLIVRDVKRRLGRFVILDHAAYLDLIRRAEEREAVAPRIVDVDFEKHGLFWDRPTMTNERFAAILGDGSNPDHRWAWARALERLPSRVITRAVGLGELRRLVSMVKLRPRVRDAWEGALEFWTEEARHRLE